MSWPTIYNTLSLLIVRFLLSSWAANFIAQFYCSRLCLCCVCGLITLFVLISAEWHFFLGDLTNSHEWNPDIISGVVRPPEQIKLVHDLEAIRSVSSLSSSTGMFCSHWQLSCC